MALGPVEYVVLAFPGNKFTGEVAPALQEVVDKGIIRIIDLVFATKDSDGNVAVMEFADLDPEIAQALDPVIGDISGMLSEEDMAELGELLEPNSSGALLLFEHVWAVKLRDALANANGVLIDGGLIPQELAEEAAAQAEAAAAA
jgi:uncharacterized membrane protein